MKRLLIIHDFIQMRTRQKIYATIRQSCFVVDSLTIERTNLNWNNIPEVECNEFESCWALRCKLNYGSK